MKTNLKNIIYSISSIVIIFPAILFISDYIYFQEPLSRVALYTDELKCNLDCVEKMDAVYRCAEIKPDEFVCRRERGHAATAGFSNVQSHSAGPWSYGEIVDFPEGKADVRFFNIENMKIIDRNSKTIQLDFNDSRVKDADTNVIYSAELHPGDTFVSHCVDNRESIHLVKYTDLYEYENKTYAEFWGLHPFSPPELFPCDLPKTLESSLKIKYDILLPEYEEFRFDIQKEYDTTYDDTEPKSEPEPAPTSTTHQNLIDARNKLREIYQINSSLGPFNIKDVIVGYGIGDGFLVVDILEKYYDSDEDRKLIIQKIIDITDEKVDIEFNSSGAIVPKNIESVFPYVWNGFLQKNGIEFTPKEQSYWNTGEGFGDVNRVCSPIIASNGTEFHISSIFILEPFEITGTFIDKTMPEDCYKVWKTDTILVEPDRILKLWLENYHRELKNEN
jgi:hypothetical protein